MAKGIPGSSPKCLIEHCPDRAWARGWCKCHYEHWRVYGHPIARYKQRRSRTYAQRLWSFVDFHGPIPGTVPHLGACWLWTGYRVPEGYGRFDKAKRRGVVAHRATYEITFGAVPEGLELDHLCRNPPCVNPWHLEPVTHAENVRRAPWTQRTHCPQGHEYTEANIVWGSRNRRTCRTCKNERARLKYHASRRESDDAQS